MVKLLSILNSVLNDKAAYAERYRGLLDTKSISKLSVEDKAITELAKVFESELVVSSDQDIKFITDSILNILNTGKDFSEIDIVSLISNLRLIANNTKSTETKNSILRVIIVLDNLEKVTNNIVQNGNIDNLQKIINRYPEIRLKYSFKATSNQGKTEREYKISVTDNLIGKLGAVLATKLLSEVNSVIGRGNKNTLKYLNSVNWVDVTASPSIEEDISELVTAIFLESKAKARKSRKANTLSKKLIRHNTGTILAYKTSLRSKKAKIKVNKVSSVQQSLFQLRSLINLKLHDAIRANMGSSSDPPIKLRYQTGRFAKSAHVHNISKAGSTRAAYLRVYYTYMRYPYDVFLPGHRLYLPQRNPTKIIGKSIRDILIPILDKNIKVETILR